jgi:hypothetical protein
MQTCHAGADTHAWHVEPAMTVYLFSGAGAAAGVAVAGGGAVCTLTGTGAASLQQRHALYLRHALEGWLFAILALYFIWFWRHGGQTLAMKTWRIKLVSKDGNTQNRMAAPSWVRSRVLAMRAIMRGQRLSKVGLEWRRVQHAWVQIGNTRSGQPVMQKLSLRVEINQGRPDDQVYRRHPD